MRSDPPSTPEGLPLILPGGSLGPRDRRPKKKPSLRDSLFGKARGLRDSLFGRNRSLRDSLYGKGGAPRLPDPIDSPWSVPPGGLEAARAFVADDEVGDAKLVELITTVHGTECWRGEREDGTGVAVHVMLPGASADMRAHFMAQAVQMQELCQERPLEGLLWVTTVDPLVGAYVGEASPIGTIADLTTAQWDVERQLACVRQVCETFGRMHEAGLVHGCLRPENVLLDEDLQPCVANTRAVDVAAACRADPDADLARSPYAAPEVRAGTPADARSDVYSLGRLIHHVLLGKEPHEPDEELPRLTSLSKAPSGLVRIVRRCTARDPADRYPSATALVNELDRYAHGEEVGISHPQVVDAYDPLRHAAILRHKQKDDGAPKIRARAAARKRAKGGKPVEPRARRPTQAKAVRGDGRRRLFVSAAAGLLGVLVLAGALWASYLGGESSTVAWLGAMVGAAALSQALPGFGPRPMLTRVAAALGCVAAVVFLDPAGLAASAGSPARRLSSGDPQTRVTTMQQLKAAGRTDFPQMDLAGADLSGQDLRGLVLDGSSLRGAQCRGVRIEGAYLINVDVTDADFSGAALADLNTTQLIGWASAICDAATQMPTGWSCADGHPVRRE